jgi:uncharacterized protein YdhG (YjbR/CyaY superfamily)
MDRGGGGHLAAPTNVDEYLADVPDDQRRVLQELRDRIRAAAPEATEVITYGMPGFKLHGRFLVSYAAYKAHCSLYPASEGVQAALGKDLGRFFASKGTLRFTVEEAIPAALVSKIVKARVREVEDRA